MTRSPRPDSKGLDLRTEGVLVRMVQLTEAKIFPNVISSRRRSRSFRHRFRRQAPWRPACLITVRSNRDRDAGQVAERLARAVEGECADRVPCLHELTPRRLDHPQAFYLPLVGGITPAVASFPPDLLPQQAGWPVRIVIVHELTRFTGSRIIGKSDQSSLDSLADLQRGGSAPRLASTSIVSRGQGRDHQCRTR